MCMCVCVRVCLFSYSREVKSIGRVAALVPRVHLGGGRPVPVSVHLDKRTGEGTGGQQDVSLSSLTTVQTAALTMSEFNGFTLTFRMELLVRVHTLVLCLNAVLTCRGRRRDMRTNVAYDNRIFFFFYLRVEKTVEKENKKSLRKKKKILEKIFFSRFRTLGLRTTHLQRVEDGENVEEDQGVRVDGQDAEDPGDSKDGKEDGDRLDGESGTRTETGGRFSRDQGTHGHSERHAHSLDRVGVSVNLVILSTDPRDDPGHGYQDANVDLDNQRTS